MRTSVIRILFGRESLFTKLILEEKFTKNELVTLRQERGRGGQSSNRR